MEKTYTFTNDELYTLKRSISQRIYRCERLLDDAKFFSPADTVKIGNLSEVLSTLNSIYDKISGVEGGDK